MSTQTVGQATTFGRYMKQWRRQRGLSQLELAVQANVSQRHVSFIEKVVQGLEKISSSKSLRR